MTFSVRVWQNHDRHSCLDSPLSLSWVHTVCALVLFLLGSSSSIANNVGNSAVQWVDFAHARQVADAPSAATVVQLPDAWNALGRSGTWIYDVTFDGPGGAATWGLYIPRIGNRVSIKLNGWPVGQLGALTNDFSDYAQRPHFFPLPNMALRDGKNKLELVVQGELARYAGMSNLAVGPIAAVQRMYYWRELLQTQASFAIVVLSLVFGLASTALAWTSRERIFTLFSLACYFSAARTSYALVVDSAPLDYRWWNWIVDTSFAGYLICLSLFCLEVIRVRPRWAWLITSVLVALTAVLVPLHAFGRLAWARQTWTTGMMVYSMCFSFALVYCWWRTKSTATRVFGIAGLVAVLMGLYDHVLVFYTSGGFGSFALARYSLLLFLVAMAWVLVEKYAVQHLREIELRRQLQDELEVKTSALVSQFQRQSQLIETIAHEQERERLVHDLHDGIGLQLNTLLYMAEAQPGPPSEMLNEVRTTIDQMRMLVDNSQSFEGSFQELLGHVRHRIEGRLQRIGVHLDWQVSVPDFPLQVPENQAVAFQHLMFELTTNVIKHANARSMAVRVAASGDEDSVVLRVSDDGIGFDTQVAAMGCGHRSMQRRILQLQGCQEPDHGGNICHIHFALGRLSLPKNHQAPADY